jgi:uncharacterized protein with PIN domain
MVIDTSAVLAILQDEPERRAFNEAIEAADTLLADRPPAAARLIRPSALQRCRTK